MSEKDSAISLAREVMEGISSLATQYGPNLYQTVGKTLQLLSIAEIITGILLIILSVSLVNFALKWFKDVDESDWMFNPLPLICSIFGGITCLIMFIAGLTCVFDSSNWASAFSPDVAVVVKVLDSIGK